MLRLDLQMKISEYRGIYDVVVPKNHMLRKIKETVDFDFVNPMLWHNYCEEYGRPAKEPVLMFKLLFLKKLYDLSDVEVIQTAEVNMAYKYFLDLDPEDSLVAPSLLTRFRKERLKGDNLEEMLKETVNQAVEKGIIKSRSILVDSTHSKSSTKHETPTQILRRFTKELRKELYNSQPKLAELFPEKPEITADLNEEIAYSRELLEQVMNGVNELGTSKSKKLLNRISELLNSDKIKEIQSAVDEDAKLGHKSETNSFFGYKTHLAMTDERIISAVEVTTGEAGDGEQLQSLIETSMKNGVEVNEVIGDTAYSGKENLKYAESHGITMVTKLNPIISNGNGLGKKGFVYNKDADTYQCPAGCLACHERVLRKKEEYQENDSVIYSYDVSICKKCALREGCYKDGAKSNTFSVRILSQEHSAQKEFQESDYFKERARKRYKIEAKNAELKQSHGLGVADSVGVFAMQVQSYFTAFVANTKRIVKLCEVRTV